VWGRLDGTDITLSATSGEHAVVGELASTLIVAQDADRVTVTGSPEDGLPEAGDDALLSDVELNSNAVATLNNIKEINGTFDTNDGYQTTREVYALDRSTGDREWTAELTVRDRWHLRGYVVAGDERVFIPAMKPYAQGYQDDPDAVGDGRLVVLNSETGETVWHRSFPEGTDALRAFDGGLLVRTGESLVALDGDGERRWRRSVAPGAAVAVEAGHAVVAGEDVVGVAPDGTVDWDLEPSGEVRRLVGTDGRVAVVGSRGTRAVAADDGAELWAGGATVRPDAAVVGPEALYYVLGRAVGATDGDGRRWRRGLPDDREGCCPTVGWLDGETVAFLLRSGEIVWFQRETEDRGLL